ncbi:hypothetical protein NC652_021772 [Populus alba x Populus x berolinensis]|nr:hypothetical protein NC652_021772 [Populus alba x Populus x berolinensis]
MKRSQRAVIESVFNFKERVFYGQKKNVFLGNQAELITLDGGAGNLVLQVSPLEFARMQGQPEDPKRKNQRLSALCLPPWTKSRGSYHVGACVAGLQSRDCKRNYFCKLAITLPVLPSFGSASSRILPLYHKRMGRHVVTRALHRSRPSNR